MNTNKQSLPQEDPDAVMVDSPKENEDSVALQSFPSPTKSLCTPTEDNDLHGLISSSRHSSQASVSPEPVDHSSPKLPWEKLYMTEAHQTSSTLSNTFPRGSINSMRRASSVHEIEGYSNSKNIFRDRHTSEGMWHQHRPQARLFKSRPQVAADFKRRCFLNACRCNKNVLFFFFASKLPPLDNGSHVRGNHFCPFYRSALFWRMIFKQGNQHKCSSQTHSWWTG